jgi:hypothetical protein
MMRRRGILGSQGPARQFIDEQLITAHSLFESGRFLEAGQAFERIAELAASRRGPRAPRFYIQAGRAFLHAGNIEHGMALLEKSHRLFLQYGRTNVIPLVSMNLQAELQQMGLKDQAKQVAQWAAGMPAPQSSTDVSSKKHPVLPLKCPSCGGPLLPNEPVWLDENTAECIYCGSPIRAD